MSESSPQSLITIEEAEGLNPPKKPVWHLVSMIILGALMVTVATLVILILVSLTNSSGIETVLPFLSNRPL